MMKRKFFTVGPSEAHPALTAIMEDALREQIPSISHRSAQFESLVEATVASLRRLLSIPASMHVFFLGSATEAMERILENCVEARSSHFVNGSFSKRFYTIALELKKNAEIFEASAGEAFDLKEEEPKGAELICLTQNETSTGAQTAMEDMYALRKRYPHVLFALDIVSSAPYVQVDYSQIDSAFFSVQKGFGMPSGLGVLLVNDRCIEKSMALLEKGLNIGTYHNFPTLLKYGEKNQTPETPNVLGIYTLGRIAKLYNDYGTERVRRETEEKAALLYDFFENRAGLRPFVQNPKWRSLTTIAIEVEGGSRPLLEKL